MNSDSERTNALHIYDEEARLRGCFENVGVIVKLFDAVSHIDLGLLGEMLVTEHWIKSVVTEKFIIYRRLKQENDFTELVLPCVKDMFYEAQILASGARYAEFHRTTIAEVLERWIEATSSKTLQDVSAPNLSSFVEKSDYFGSTYDGAREANAATFSARM